MEDIITKLFNAKHTENGIMPKGFYTELVYDDEGLNVIAIRMIKHEKGECFSEYGLGLLLWNLSQRSEANYHCSNIEERNRRFEYGITPEGFERNISIVYVESELTSYIYKDEGYWEKYKL